jgi:hypothetical protein
MHWLTEFGTTELPQLDVIFPNGTAPVVFDPVALPGGGVFDALGTGRARPRYPFALQYDCYVADQDSTVALATLAGLKQRLGERDKLWRTEAGGTTRYYAWARLVDVDDTMRTLMPMWAVPVKMTFSVLGSWNGIRRGATWYLDDGEGLDENLFLDRDNSTTLTTGAAGQDVTVTNSGNMAVRDAKIIVTAAASSITSVTVAVSGVTEVTWTGTLAVGSVLVIDAGAKRVTVDDVNAWSTTAFTLTSNHKVADWLVLEPGANTVTVTTVGGGTTSTVAFEFNDGHF